MDSPFASFHALSVCVLDGLGEDPPGTPLSLEMCHLRRPGRPDDRWGICCPFRLSGLHKHRFGFGSGMFVMERLWEEEQGGGGGQADTSAPPHLSDVPLLL